MLDRANNRRKLNRGQMIINGYASVIDSSALAIGIQRYYKAIKECKYENEPCAQINRNLTVSTAIACGYIDFAKQILIHPSNRYFSSKRKEKISDLFNIANDLLITNSSALWFMLSLDSVVRHGVTSEKTFIPNYEFGGYVAAAVCLSILFNKEFRNFIYRTNARKKRAEEVPAQPYVRTAIEKTIDGLTAGFKSFVVGHNFIGSLELIIDYFGSFHTRSTSIGLIFRCMTGFTLSALSGSVAVAHEDEISITQLFDPNHHGKTEQVLDLLNTLANSFFLGTITFMNISRNTSASAQIAQATLWIFLTIILPLFYCDTPMYEDNIEFSPGDIPTGFGYNRAPISPPTRNRLFDHQAPLMPRSSLLPRVASDQTGSAQEDSSNKITIRPKTP